MSKLKLKRNKFYLLGCGAVIHGDYYNLQGAGLCCHVAVPGEKKFTNVQIGGDIITHREVGHGIYATWNLDGTMFLDSSRGKKNTSVVREVTREEARQIRKKRLSTGFVKLLKAHGYSVKTPRGNVLELDKIHEELNALETKFWHGWL